MHELSISACALASTDTTLDERCFLPRSSEMTAFGEVLF